MGQVAVAGGGGGGGDAGDDEGVQALLDTNAAYMFLYVPTSSLHSLRDHLGLQVF